jgi:hypothetical protein
MREKIYIGAVLVTIGTFHAATVRQDISGPMTLRCMYITRRTLSKAALYTATGYVFNASMVVGPKYYPPIFPAFRTISRSTLVSLATCGAFVTL